MASLYSIAELVWRQIHPRPGDETAVMKEEVIASAKIEYAGIMAIAAYQKRAVEEFEVPSEIVDFATIKVDTEKGEADISDLQIIRGLPNDLWWIALTGKCQYVKTTAASVHLFDSDNTGKVRVYATKNKLIFPEGVKETELNFVFAGSGQLDDYFEMSEELGYMVRDRLEKIYLGKVGKEDLTNNAASDV